MRNIREHMVFPELFSGFYPLLNDLLNKYHAIYQDYVQQYIQPTKKDLSER